MVKTKQAAKETAVKKKAATKSAAPSVVNQQKAAMKAELKDLAGIEARRDFLRILLAGILLILGIFLLIAIVSNVFTGCEDQAGVDAGYYFDAANKGGFLGAVVSRFLMNQLFGFGAIMIPIFLLCAVFKLVMRAACPLRLWVTFIHSVIIMTLISVDAAYLQTCLPGEWLKLISFEMGGLHGNEIVGTVNGYLGGTITSILLLTVTVGYLGFWFTQIFIWIFKGFNKLGDFIFRTKKNDDEDNYNQNENDDYNQNENDNDNDDDNDDDNDNDDDDENVEVGTETILFENVDADAETEAEAEEDQNEEPEDVVEPSTMLEAGTNDDEAPLNLEINETQEEAEATVSTVQGVDELSTPYDPKLDLSRYQYPPVTLLEKHVSSGNPTTKEELEANKDRIIHVLSTFGVKISSIAATVGPTVTLYEITPAPGVRIAKIRNLEADIALSLAALGIRIIAPIPGKGTIGIEVPNARPQVVSMESIINTEKFRNTKYDLPIALGKTITNEIFMVDLAKMPHLLVAGATGQGKSVGLNAIITSLLFKKHPSELKLVMIDPKKVEFSMYNPIINHFLAQVPDSDEPVITDVKKVICTLKSLCQEMDERYDLLKMAHCRNIKEYNEKFCSRHLLPTDGHKYMPYIVVIIDEFGDLIMTAGKEIELPIARIAQLARAVGIHMVIATQSPRATIITGKIKANFPGRMAFRVSQRVESQTILDRNGADNLIGRGDMLFQAGSDLTRVQCAFVDTPEVVAIAQHIESQQAYPGPFELPLVVDDGTDGLEGISSTDGSSTFEQVAHFVVSMQSGSTSKIQRQFKVGFNRAGRLMDQLEEAGIVGPQMGSKPREILVHSEVELQRILDALREAGHHFE